jgi:hypothetical protein
MFLKKDIKTGLKKHGKKKARVSSWKGDFFLLLFFKAILRYDY